MATARDLIAGSLRLIGALGSGETPTAEAQSEGLLLLNDILESWSLEGLMVYSLEKETFSLTGAQSSYTMGDGGDFDTTRPVEIIRAKILNSSTEIDVKIITAKEWADIQLKTLQSTIPQVLYAQGTAPLETINLYPVPSSSGSLVLYSRKQLTEIASANTTLTFPPGYRRALKYTLAGELSLEYGKQISPILASIANESKNVIMRKNTQPTYMVTDAPAGQRRSFNFETGE
jgi:hypothetical protein